MLADPGDDVTRLVFADWLEEQETPGIVEDLRRPGMLTTNKLGWLVWRPNGTAGYLDYWLVPPGEKHGDG